MLGSEITRRLADSVKEDTYHVLCRGAGGQSFGAFIPCGLTLELVGDSNVQRFFQLKIKYLLRVKYHLLSTLLVGT